MQRDTEHFTRHFVLENSLLGLGLLLAIVVLLWQINVQTPRLWEEGKAQTVQVETQYYSLSSTQLSWLKTFTAEYFAAAELVNREQVHTQISVHLDSSFARVEERLPVFADWYYSLRGEYSRLAMAALSATSLADGDYVARRAAQLLFPEQIWESGLRALEVSSNESLLSSHQSTRREWLKQVQGRFNAQRVPAPIDHLQGQLPVLNLNALNQQLSALEEISALDNRIALSSLGAAGLAGPALWRAVAARNALASSRVLASTGARGSARIASAAGGAVICAPGGPLAIACAAGAGIATWLATDWLLLQVDEAINRDDLIETMSTGLLDLRKGLEQELLTAYDARLAALQSASQEQILEGFELTNRE
ncbi:MAG: hypothetical protein ACSHXZ_09255 [Gammaproteobacteria bacterium]